MDIDIKGLLLILRKKWWWIVSIVSIATIAAGVTSYYLVKPTYEASSQIIVNSTKGAGEGAISINEVNMDLRLIETYKEIVKNVSMMEKVTTAYPELGFTASQLASKAKVNSVNNTQVITISFQDASYLKAANTVNAISIVFQKEIPKLMKTDNVSILGIADVNASPSPVSPKTLFNITITFMISFLVSIGWILLIEYLDDTVKSEEEIQKILELPNLATVGVIHDSDYEVIQNQTLQKKGKIKNVSIGHEA
ncbi:YveK family protein [Paenibacillus sp. 1001270B_150601_E10]|uniref:YveK family protein n=1 Tax=Paenibacillus sp. 1001270B_150601_E10 TaxID=2787079 RepID=UPI00189D97E8|nr:Wzz/FepE/Etk N-terminal domain-containing protein [Paenibacillus sp. 1001270B_150601_E10]